MSEHHRDAQRLPAEAPAPPKLRRAYVRGRPHLWLEGDMVSALQAAASADGTLSRRRYDLWAVQRDAPSSATIVRYFGSWNTALYCAGLDVSRKAPRA